MGIFVRHLTKIYGHQRAIDDISFEAKTGEIVGFLGPNGAGKSTTMKILTCFIPPSSGQATVEGYDVLENPLLVRRAVGYLPEHNPLYLDMYVPEALYFAASVFGIRGKILRERVSAMIELVGLEPEKHKKVGALSKGYRQRVGLAQALIHEPSVLILDEPTTGLDPNQIVEIRQLIKRISQQKTVLLSTHLMQEVQALCQRVIILNKGKIVADSAIDVLKQEKSQVTTVVELAPDSNPQFLQHIPHVERIEKIGENTYQLTPQDGKDLRAEIFRQAVANNATLLSLFLQDVSLEKIFQQLTR